MTSDQLTELQGESTMKRTTITLIDSDHDAEPSTSEQTLLHMIETHLGDGALKHRLLAAVDEFGRTQFGRGYLEGGAQERRARY